jgi:hypothetical protein
MKRHISRAALSVRIFAFYLLSLGAVLLLVPNWLLALFALPTTTEVWIRVVGMLVILLAYYYHRASSHGWVEFYRATVHARTLVLVCFTGFVLLGMAPPVLIVFGAVDAAAAAWTAWCLARDQRDQEQP